MKLKTLNKIRKLAYKTRLKYNSNDFIIFINPIVCIIKRKLITKIKSLANN